MLHSGRRVLSAGHDILSCIYESESNNEILNRVESSYSTS